MYTVLPPLSKPDYVKIGRLYRKRLIDRFIDINSFLYIRARILNIHAWQVYKQCQNAILAFVGMEKYL